MISPWKYIESDLYRHTGKITFGLMVKNYLINPSFKYMFWLRLCKSSNIFLRGMARIVHKILSIRYQMQIPREVDIGFGLYLGHGTGIIINGSASIGNNCNLSPFLVIGSNKGKAATIGDNVYIGPHVSIVENVNIGSGVIIGAASVVLKNAPPNTIIVGNPGRVVKDNIENQYILKNIYIKK